MLTWLQSVKFQSTLPVRGATNGGLNNPPEANIFQSTLPVRGATQEVVSA